MSVRSTDVESNAASTPLHIFKFSGGGSRGGDAHNCERRRAAWRGVGAHQRNAASAIRIAYVEVVVGDDVDAVEVVVSVVTVVAVAVVVVVVMDVDVVTPVVVVSVVVVVFEATHVSHAAGQA